MNLTERDEERIREEWHRLNRLSKNWGRVTLTPDQVFLRVKTGYNFSWN